MFRDDNTKTEKNANKMTDRCREEFEKIFESRGLCLKRWDKSVGMTNYKSQHTQDVWVGWQAAWNARGEWLPMESAPKDGTWILIQTPKKEVWQIQWRDDDDEILWIEADCWQPLPEARKGKA